MNLESGKYYRLRDGQVRGPVRACIPDSDLFTDEVYYWRADGRQHGLMTNDEHPLDIISEAEKPEHEAKRGRYVSISAIPATSHGLETLYVLDTNGVIWERVVGRKWTRIEGPEVGT